MANDLHEAGVSDWFMHVISQDEMGLRRRNLRSSNYFETLDLVRDGVIGALIGLLLGLAGVGLLNYFEPFGSEVPGFVYVALVILATLFGAWEGGLFGVDTTSQKLKRFRSDIESGKYLMLIYARRGQGAAVKKMMADKHPEASHVATDRHFINPFSEVRRRPDSSGHASAA